MADVGTTWTPEKVSLGILRQPRVPFPVSLELTPPNVKIVPATVEHIYLLAEHMRTGDAMEIEAAGFDVRVGIRRTYYASVLRRTALVDDQVAAMWGVCGTLISNTGTPWLLTAEPIERVPVTFVKQARRQLGVMLGLYRRLENFVAADYVRAVRLLDYLGFKIDDPKPIGPKGALFHRFWKER